MRRNWMDSLAKGVDIGYKLGNMYQEGKMKRELKDANALDQQVDNTYSPEQQAKLSDAYGPKEGEKWVPATDSSQGYYESNSPAGVVTQRQVASPTVSANGIYTNPDGSTVVPKASYSLGSVVRDKAFTPDEISTAKLNRKADIYSNYGNEQMAESMRGNALQRESLGLQNAKLKGDAETNAKWTEAVQQATTFSTKAHEAFTPTIKAVQDGSMPLDKGVNAMLSTYNDHLPDGSTVSYDAKAGTLTKTTNGKSELVMDASGKPVIITAEHLNEFPDLAKGATNAWLHQKRQELYPGEFLQLQQLQDSRDNRNQDLSLRAADTAYSHGRDAVGDARYENKFTYEQSQDKFRNKLASEQLGISQAASGRAGTTFNQEQQDRKDNAPLAAAERSQKLRVVQLQQVISDPKSTPEQINAAVDQYNRLQPVTDATVTDPMDPANPKRTLSAKVLPKVNAPIKPYDEYVNARKLAKTNEQKIAIDNRARQMGLIK